MSEFKKAKYEYLRSQAKNKFNNVRETWIDCGLWALPHRVKWMLSQTPGARNNRHIVDGTHLLALRSFGAGFLEGNTSASRPWYRIESKNDDVNKVPANRDWLQKYTTRTLKMLAGCNFYYAAGGAYLDFGVFNTAGHFIEERKGSLYWHVMVPGSYFVINNVIGEAVVLVREMSFSVKALVDEYGKKDANGNWDWSNFSPRVRLMYESSNYVQMIDCVQIVHENEDFDPSKPQVLLNRRWMSSTYELGGMGGQYYQDGQEFGAGTVDPRNAEVYLEQKATKRKPFIIPRSDAGGNFEYGEKGPTTDSLGLIKSLNKKAISKDQAIEQMLRPALQGPANLRKSYITTTSNAYVPLDPTSASQKGLRSIFDVNPQISTLVQDVGDLREQVNKFYYADYLLYLSQNPKTRTATETNAVVSEQQLVIGPMLQSLNWTYNVPVVEFIMDYVLWEDPFLPPPPKGLEGQFLQAQFISVFAQAQKAADLPSINQYVQAMLGLAQASPAAMQKFNVDKYADLLEDRLYLPVGLNNPQGKVDALRQQAQAAQQRQQMLEQTLPAVAGAAKNMSQAQAQGQPVPQQGTPMPAGLRGLQQ